MSADNTILVNIIMAVVLLLVIWNLILAKRKGEINVGLAKYIWNGSPTMRHWFIGGVIVNVLVALWLIFAFAAQLMR